MALGAWLLLFSKPVLPAIVGAQQLGALQQAGTLSEDLPVSGAQQLGGLVQAGTLSIQAPPVVVVAEPSPLQQSGVGAYRLIQAAAKYPPPPAPPKAPPTPVAPPANWQVAIKSKRLPPPRVAAQVPVAPKPAWLAIIQSRKK